MQILTEKEGFTVKARNISKALGGISDEYLEEAEEYTARRAAPRLVKWASVAACFLVLAIGATLVSVLAKDEPDGGITPCFSIVANAEDGKSYELYPGESFLNSGSSGANIFGNNKPTFNISLMPKPAENGDDVFRRYDITVSYNGKTVDGKDKHVSVAYMMLQDLSMYPDSIKQHGIAIIGWFDEPATIRITVTEKESGEVVEEIIVNVKYNAELQKYELERTSLEFDPAP